MDRQEELDFILSEDPFIDEPVLLFVYYQPVKCSECLHLCE